jgi:penicillin G amidase
MPPVRGVPRLDGTLTIAGPDRPIEILRDPSGVPHVRAQTTHDAFFGQGFVHAQDRLWQMVYDRHRAAGRLSEWLGPRSPVQIMDVFCRRMDLCASAQRDEEHFDEETTEVLAAYAQGVNAFIASDAPLPLELQLLEIDHVDPWETWHTGAVLKVRHVLMGTFEVKLWRQRLVDSLGPVGALSPGSSHGRDDLLIVPVGAREPHEAPALAGAQPDGSNNWAVHGSRTRSGKPLVAGDPHRSLEAPNVYYQNHVSCPEFDAIGFSMAGVPGMFHFGHNEHVAWCVTHAMADTQDLYLERPEDITRTKPDTIHIRGAKDITFDVSTTKHGPVVITDPPMSLRWTGSDRPNASLKTILPMLKAKSVAELDDVMRDWVDPCNNLVMADTSGNIAYLCRGRHPIRSKANAWTPVPGWTDEHEWTGDVPYEELPRIKNPEQGYIVTANNRIVGNDYPYFLGMDYSQPGRAERILDRLEELSDATIDDMAAIHGERVSMPARIISEHITELDGWDGDMDPGSREALVYYAIRDELAAVLCERGSLAATVDNPYADEEPYPSPAHYRIRTAVPRIIGTDLVPDGAIAEARKRVLGKIEADAVWGDVHRTKTVHPVSRLFPDAALDPPPVAMGGDGDTPQAGSEERGLGIVHSSVARYAFDLGDWDRSGWIVPLGSSGHADSPHYADQAQDWADVKLRPMLYSWSRIEADAETRQVLDPT